MEDTTYVALRATKREAFGRVTGHTQQGEISSFFTFIF
jgi:hypothetical protein